MARVNIKQRHSLLLKALSFIVKLNSNSCMFLNEFQKLTSAFQCISEEHTSDVEYEALIQNKKTGKHILIRNGDVIYETSNWIDLLLVLQECFLNDFIKFTRGYYYLLHSAVVVKKGKAVIFPGPSKSGKSTLCIALLKDGFKYLSDEVAAVDLNTLKTGGFPRAIAIREKTLFLFPTLEPEIQYKRYRSLNLEKAQEIHYGIPSEMKLAIMNRSFPILAFVFSKYSPKGYTVLNEINSSSAIFNLMQCSLNQGGLKERGFRTAVKLVRQTKCYELQINDLAKACEAVDSLFHEVY